MMNLVDIATNELQMTLEHYPDHIHSGAVLEILKSLLIACDNVKPEFRYLPDRYVSRLQDIAHEATVQARRKPR